MIHIRPTAQLAERVLLPGDPGRALRLVQALLRSPKMLNHNRGLWGYTGIAADGELLSIQSTGMGGPSAAIVTHELIELGARRLLRIGTCGSLRAELGLGRIVIAEAALSDDGTSRQLGAHAPLARVAAAAPLLQALRDAAGDLRAPAPLQATVVSTDLYYDASALHPRWLAAGAVAVEMEAAAILTVCARHGVQGGCALLVSNTLADAHDQRQIEEQQLHDAELSLGALAAAALGAGAATGQAAGASLQTSQPT